MPEIQGLEVVLNALRDRAARVSEDQNVSAVVGYSAAYALYVHEDLTARHGADYNAAYIVTSLTRGGKRKHEWSVEALARGYERQGKARPRGENQQAKFLEQPARQYAEEFSRIIVEALQQGKTVAQALLLAALRLLRESQKICPVDKGNLKASGFTRLEYS